MGLWGKPTPKAGIEIGAGAGQPRAVLGEVGGATVQQGWEEARGDTQGEVVPETGVGVGAGQMVVWKGPKAGEGGHDSSRGERSRGSSGQRAGGGGGVEHGGGGCRSGVRRQGRSAEGAAADGGGDHSYRAEGGGRGHRRAGARGMEPLEGREGSEVSGRGAQGDVVRGDKAVVAGGQRSLDQDLGREAESSQGGAGARGRGSSSDSCEGGGDSWDTEEKGGRRRGPTAEETESSEAEAKAGTASEGGPRRRKAGWGSDGGARGSGDGGSGSMRTGGGGVRQAREAAGPSGGDRRHAASSRGGWAQGHQRHATFPVGSEDGSDNRPSRQEADMQQREAGRAGGGSEGQGSSGGGSGRLLGDSIDEASVHAQEAEACIRGARRKGADILSSTTEDGEEHLLRHHEDQPGGDDGSHCAGDEEAEAEDSGAEDQVGGGVDQCALQYILQDGLHKRGAPVQGQDRSRAAANEGDGEGTAGGGGGQASAKGAAAHRVSGRAEGRAAADRGDDGRRGGGDRPQGDGVVLWRTQKACWACVTS